MCIVMTAPVVDYKIHWLKMMSVPESRAIVRRHDGINGRNTNPVIALSHPANLASLGTQCPSEKLLNHMRRM